jgi:hypothetical protein
MQTKNKNNTNMKKRFYLVTAFIFSMVLNVFAQWQQTQLIIPEGIEPGALKSAIESNVSSLLMACNEAAEERKKPNLPKKIITVEGKNNLNMLWETTEIFCKLSQVTEKCLHRPDGGYQVRNIPVVLKAAPEEESQREIVINLTSTGVIEDIFISIKGTVYNDILSKYKTVEDLNRRTIIADFLEKFSTSYEKKELNYIEKVFSDNALIITGRVIKTAPKADQGYQPLSKERIEYLSQTKTQYITRLKTLFSNYKRINVRFDSIEVVRHPVLHEIYGVTLKQDWRSKRYAGDGYADVGYLFLLIDFRDNSNPLIQIRTRQPTMYDNKPLRRDEVFSLSSFPNIIREEN